jgi:dCMP deaminase
MDLAVRSAKMSYCKRLQVGATAVRDRRPILTGWNGTSPGEDNCCEEEIWVEVMDVGMGIESRLVTKQSVNHAERNLIEYAAREGISLKGCSLYITHAPCIECAKSIRNSGIIELIYKDIYRCDAGLKHLKNMTVRQYA